MAKFSHNGSNMQWENIDFIVDNDSGQSVQWMNDLEHLFRLQAKTKQIHGLIKAVSFTSKMELSPT